MPVRPPLYLEQPEQDFRVKRLPERKAVYVQYRWNNDSNAESISDFGVRVEELLDETQPRFIILDQRFNGGGDYTTTAGLMSSLPGRLPDDGQLFLITGLQDVANGCHEPHCYWTNFFNNVAAGRLDPDVVVATRFVDYQAGRDPVLDRIWELVESHP